jgi:hypothetical protein
MAAHTRDAPQAHEVKAVLAARRILERHHLEHLPLSEAVLHLRASFAVEHGLRAYVAQMIGKLSRLPVRRFSLYADTAGTSPLPVDDGDLASSLDDYLGGFNYRCLPERIDLLQRREDDPPSFYL